MWIEFLSYEYWKYDRSADVVNLRQSRHDEGWKKLVDSQVPEPCETEESLWNFTNAQQLIGKESEAKKATSSATSTMRLAEQALQKAQRAGPSGQSLSQMEQELSIAKSILAAVTRSFDQISRRRELISEFKSESKSYSIAKDNIKKQNDLLRWILQQVPLVQLELRSAGLIENDSAQGNGRHQRCVKRFHAADHNEEPVSKRQREDDENHSLSKSKTRTSTTQETSSAQWPRHLGSSHPILEL